MMNGLRSLWGGLGRAFQFLRPSSALGFVSAPLGLLGLLAPWWPLMKIGAAVGLFWFGYTWVWDRGYNARDAEYAAAIKAANYEITRLNTELEAERVLKEVERENATGAASVGVPDLPQCVKSECALSADVVSRLNKVN